MPSSSFPSHSSEKMGSENPMFSLEQWPALFNCIGISKFTADKRVTTDFADNADFLICAINVCFTVSYDKSINEDFC